MLSEAMIFKKDQIKRKARKLKRDPIAFFVDSKAYIATHKTMYYTWAKMGSFVIVLMLSFLVVLYYGFLASDRYASETQFIIKQANNNDVQITGIASFGSVSHSVKDAQVLKRYIESREMASYLNALLLLKEHYQSNQWDFISRLSSEASSEDYVKYYKEHITVRHDQLSDILIVEVQAFNPSFAHEVASEILTKSEEFINNLGGKMASEQVAYAEKEVKRAYGALSESQDALIKFQDSNRLFSPEQQSTSILGAIARLESEIINDEAELKSLTAFMHETAPEVQAKKIRVAALRQQLEEEKKKLTNSDAHSINNITADYKKIKLSSELAENLYATALTSLEATRADAYRKLKHLLIVERPAIAEEGKYPSRIYNIATWFLIILLAYFIGKLILAIVKEHRD